MVHSRSNSKVLFFMRNHWLKIIIVLAVIFLWKKIKGIFSDLGKPFRDLFNGIGNFWERLVNQPAGSLLTNNDSTNYKAATVIIKNGMDWFSSDYWKEIFNSGNQLAMAVKVATIDNSINGFISETVALVDKARQLYNDGNFVDSKNIVLIIKKKFKDYFDSKFITSYCFDQFEKSINGGFQQYLRFIFALGDEGSDSLYLELIQHLKGLKKEY